MHKRPAALFCRTPANQMRHVMQNQLVAAVEVLIAVVVPLFFLYLRGPWPLRARVACLLSILALWYLVYAPLHELSHIAGTYLAGGWVTSCKLIPGFRIGEFGRLWSTWDGITSEWQILINTALPYVLDMISLVAAFLLLKRNLFTGAFIVGFLAMLLCLRPAYDLVYETVAFILGERGDIFYVATIAGEGMTLSLALAGIGCSVVITGTIFRRYW